MQSGGGKKFKPKWQPITKTSPKSARKNSTQQAATANKQDDTRVKNRHNNNNNTTKNNQVVHHQQTNSILDRTLSPVPLPSPIKSVKATSLFEQAFTSATPQPQQQQQDSAVVVGHQWEAEFPQLPPPPPQQQRRSSPHLHPAPQQTIRDVSPDHTLKLIQQMTHKQQQQENTAITHTTTPTSTVEDNQFEDIKNEMMIKWGFKQPEKSSTETSQQQHNNPFDWNEIPPVIPPREPVRQPPTTSGYHRNTHRHLSTPSPPTSSSAPSCCAATSSAPPTTRSRANTQQNPSTVSVFSPIPACTSTPLIYPIMKNGKQESFTHYYLFANNKSKEQLRREQLKNEPLLSIPRPTPQSSVNKSPPTTTNNKHQISAPPRPPPPTSQSLISSIAPTNKNEGSLTSQQTSFESKSNNNNDTSTFPPRRISSSMTSHLDPCFGHRSSQPYHIHHHPSSSMEKLRSNSATSHCSDKYTSMGPSQKSIIIQSEVFGVTNEDCRSALKCNNGDVEQTIKYLKVEQLFRLGVVPRDTCKQILRSNNWNLEVSSQLVVDRHRRSSQLQTATGGKKS